QRLAALVTDCLAVGLFEDDGLTDAAQTIDAAAGGLLRKLKGAGDLPARAGETQMLLAPAGIKARRLLVVGLGKRADFRERGWRRAVSAALGACLKTRSARLALAIDPPQTDPVDAYYRGRAIAALTGAALYRVNDLKTARKPPRPALQRVTLSGMAADERRAAGRGLDHGQAIAAGQTLLRDLGNLPGNVCTPRYLARQAMDLARENRALKVRVLDEPAIKRLKMGCLLSVSRGSDEPPRFIVLEYRGGARNAKPVALVGKGVTFDTGGISLKDPGAMDEMKYDMCGA